MAHEPVVVHHAESGVTLFAPMSADSGVSLLKMSLESATGLESSFQILLLDGLKMEEDRALAENGLQNSTVIALW